MLCHHSYHFDESTVSKMGVSALTFERIFLGKFWYQAPALKFNFLGFRSQLSPGLVGWAFLGGWNPGLFTWQLQQRWQPTLSSTRSMGLWVSLDSG